MKTREEIQEIIKSASADPEGWREFVERRGKHELPGYIAAIAITHAGTLFPEGGYGARYAWKEFVMTYWQ